MVKIKDREEIFLSILQEDSNKDEIDKEIQRFSDSDWQALSDFSIKNGLLPIFYNRLLSLKLENIPSEFLSKLKKLYLRNLKKNIILEQELFKILSHFEKSNISVIPLKGPVLARYLYNDLAKRATSCDLDLLVPHKRIKEAEDRLKEIGYVFNFGKEKADFFHTFRRQITLQKESQNNNRVFVELHWNFRDKFTDTHIEEFWLNAKRTNLNGSWVLIPSLEDLLLFLTLVSISDFDFIQIKYIYDIHKMITAFAKVIHWQALINEARQFGLDKALFFSLKLSREFFNTDIPEYLFNKLRPIWIKEGLIKLWVNKKNVLYNREIIASSFTWRHFLSSFILSKNIYNCLKIIYRKIFLPRLEVRSMYGQPVGDVSIFLYLKRLMRPLSRILKREKFLCQHM